jgi:hypothetical protein
MTCIKECYTLLEFSSTSVQRYFATGAASRINTITVSPLFSVFTAQQNAFARWALLMRNAVIWVSKFAYLVQSNVVTQRHHLKILNCIVRLIFINVVNNLVRTQSSPKILLHNIPMHRYISALLKAQHQIAVTINCTSSVFTFKFLSRITVPLHASPVFYTIIVYVMNIFAFGKAAFSHLRRLTWIV